jgi:hypothetical protein
MNGRLMRFICTQSAISATAWEWINDPVYTL